MAFVSFELEFNASCATLIGWLLMAIGDGDEGGGGGGGGLF